jgi:hypothetical protein
VVLIRPQSWERHGLKTWNEAGRKRLHQNVLAITLANKLACIASAVLNKERNFSSSDVARDAWKRVAATGRGIGRNS